MSGIKLLDCTLRDGGHVTQGKFGEQAIKSIIADLVKAKIDIIEVGFLWQTETDMDTARFYDIATVKKFLPKDMGASKVSLMADNVDLEHLEPYDGTVEYIRISFRKNEMDWARKAAKTVIDKGYKCFMNPIHGSSISDKEYLEIIDMVNEIHPFAFSIVDTFGAMRQSDLARLYYLIDYNLDETIELGVHLHENLGLAYSLAQHILSIVSPKRNITIDGSLFGMGKIPGNLCIEQVMDYMNIEYQSNYATEPVYDAIDQFIMPIYHRVGGWGYSIPYAISAQCGVHRTYAEYLVNKERLMTKDVRRILKSIPEEKSEIFDKDFIEKQYKAYMNAAYDDSCYLELLSDKLKEYESVIIVAPGQSINDLSLDSTLRKKSCLITINFEYKKENTDLCFWTNAKRLGYASNLDFKRLVITSNLRDELPEAKYVISRNELIYHDDIWSDDSTLMLLNLLKKIGVKTVYIAGFDGFSKEKGNFFNEQYERIVREYDYDTNSRITVLKQVYSTMNIHFLTPSVYEVAFEK